MNMLQTLFLSFTIWRCFQEFAQFTKKGKKFVKKQQTVNIWLAIGCKLSGKSPSNM